MKTQKKIDDVGKILDSLAGIRDLDENHARSLPAGFYSSEAFLELEKEEIFRKEWICLGRVDQVAKRGDYFVTQLLDEPLIVVRGQDNKVRILSNVCRHSSSVIIEGSGNAIRKRWTTFARALHGTSQWLRN